MRILGDHLILKTKYTPQIQAVIPQTRHIEGYTVVPFTLPNTMLLKNIGFKPPSPIQTDYDWPGKYKPYKHQVLTAEFMTLNKRCYILSGLGSGKTISALWAADYLKKQGVINRVLIVSPLSTLDVVWAREIFTNFPGRSYTVLHGSADKRKKLLAEPHDFYIINHHGIKVMLQELRNRRDINLIIYDELAVARNSQTALWKSTKQLITPDRWVWGMTGSPTPQAPTDAYGQAKLITPENLSCSFTTFKNYTMLQVSAFRWVPRRQAEQVVAKALSPSIRFALRDCIDLPPTITQHRHIEMTPEQKKHYTAMLKDCMTEIKGTQVTAVNAAVVLTKIVQCSVGAVYGPDKEVLKIDCKPRLDAVAEIIEACTEKVIVFVPLTGALRMVKQDLEKRGYTCELVDGSVSKNERQRIFTAFQHHVEPRVLVAQPGAMSHGLTLTAASTTIWFAPTTSNETYLQANGRTIRPSQRCVTNIINISATKEEMKIYEGLENKTRFQDIVLEIARG